ncbi:MAG: lamin tail domain-containing protein [Saprospiraceae bacterium]|nr:lamin tail domain-containing protein [Saprospiraceae bacterium]
MKKVLSALVCSVLFTLSAQAQIVINEIMYNPPEPNTDTLEYVELFNNSNQAVDVSNWTFTQGFDFTFPGGTTIPANGYVIISENAAHFQSKFGFLPYEWVGALTNSPGEDIELTDDNGQVVDYVDYKNTAPWPLGAAGQGASIVLCDPNSDNSDPANWQACPTATIVFINGTQVFANPGLASGCSDDLKANDDQFSIISGTSATLGVLANDLTPNPVTSLNIVSAPANGVATVNPNFTITYTPAANFCDVDALQYRVCDGQTCDTAIVSLNIICYELYDIEDVTNVDANGVADAIDLFVELQGTVYGGNLRPQGLQFTIINDNNQGIAVFQPVGNFGYNVTEKDKVSIRGRIIQFNGLVQIDPDTIIKLSGNNPLVTPLTVPAPVENTESSLIRITNCRLVDDAEWTTGMGNGGFNIRLVSDNNPQDTILVRIDNDTETYNAPLPNQPFNITGIGSQFDSDSPYTSGYQLLPRYNNDISTLVGLKETDFSQEVTLAPNPATDWLRVTSTVQFDALRLYNAQGQILQSWNKPDMQENISVYGLPAGIYHLRFEKDGGVWTTRFVKSGR